MPTAATILAGLCALMYLIPRLCRIHGPGIHRRKFPEEHMLVAALRYQKLIQGFSFFCPVT